MLEIFTLTTENLKDLAKMTGRTELDLQCMLKDAEEAGKPAKIYVESQNIPEGFMRPGR